MLIAAIDPGEKGGICIVNTENNIPLFYVMPTKKVLKYSENKTKKPKNTSIVDVEALSRLLAGVTNIFIEEISIRGNQGGAVTTGMNAGRISAVAELLNAEISYVHPTQWYTLFKFKSVKTKLTNLVGQERLNAIEDNKPSLKYCRENNIHLPKGFKTGGVVVPSDGCADALMILLYGRAKYKI